VDIAAALVRIAEELEKPPHPGESIDPRFVETALNVHKALEVSEDRSQRLIIVVWGRVCESLHLSSALHVPAAVLALAAVAAAPSVLALAAVAAAPPVLSLVVFCPRRNEYLS
jgi:hypothetical protein